MDVNQVFLAIAGYDRDMNTTIERCKNNDIVYVSS
jgi:hypothetical protein